MLREVSYKAWLLVGGWLKKLRYNGNSSDAEKQICLPGEIIIERDKARYNGNSSYPEKQICLPREIIIERDEASYNYREQGKQTFLPDEIIIEILSRLPVKSLARSKCVCKLWCTIIQGPEFTKVYLSRSKWVIEYGFKNHNRGFKFLNSQDGLLLERSITTGKYRIRNPITKQIFCPPNPHRESLYMSLLLAPKTNKYKLVHIYWKEGADNAGCQVLTLGTDPTWRDLDFPSLHILRKEADLLNDVIADDIFFLIKRSSDAGITVPKVVCLDIESEQFAHVKIPETLFTSFKHVYAMCWQNKLALANLWIGVLHVWVLDDYKKEKWVERKIVMPWTLFSNNPETPCMLFPWSFESDNRLWFLRYDDSDVAYNIAYNIQTEQIDVDSPPSGKVCLRRYVPSLVSIGGNHPEKKLKRKKNKQGGEYRRKLLRRKH